MILWLALWCCRVKLSVRWHYSGHQGDSSPTLVTMVRLGCSLKRFSNGHLVSPRCTTLSIGSCSHVISYVTPDYFSFGVLSFGCTRMERSLTLCCLNVLESVSVCFRVQQHHSNVYLPLPKSDMQEDSEPALSKLDVVLTFTLEVSVIDSKAIIAGRPSLATTHM